MLSRRQWLAWSAFSVTRAARAESAVHAEAVAPAVLAQREIAVPGAGAFGKKCLVLRPARAKDDAPLPLLILFHGLGETGAEALGIRAWIDRYGLSEAYARLVSPPVTRTLPNKRYFSDQRLTEINAELAREPIQDVCIVCPFVPNPFKKDSSAPLLDGYARYVETALLPAVRTSTAVLSDPRHTGIDGVSLGGYVSIEIFLRKPELFGVVGTMQGAFGKQSAEAYARRIAEVCAKAAPRAFHVITSTFDPFREASELFARRLKERALNVTLHVPEGPHDQNFLREAGSIEMLLFQVRALTQG